MIQIVKGVISPYRLSRIAEFAHNHPMRKYSKTLRVIRRDSLCKFKRTAHTHYFTLTFEKGRIIFAKAKVTFTKRAELVIVRNYWSVK